MPYSIVKKDGKWCVVTKATGKVHGCHPDKKHAAAQLYAIRKNDGE